MDFQMGPAERPRQWSLTWSLCMKRLLLIFFVVHSRLRMCTPTCTIDIFWYLYCIHFLNGCKVCTANRFSSPGSFYTHIHDFSEFLAVISLYDGQKTSRALFWMMRYHFFSKQWISFIGKELVMTCILNPLPSLDTVLRRSLRRANERKARQCKWVRFEAAGGRLADFFCKWSSPTGQSVRTGVSNSRRLRE